MVDIFGTSPERPYTPSWRRKYEPYINQASYSGCDIVPVVYGIDPTTKKQSLFVLGDVQTITYSIHSEKGMVRTLGRKRPKGFTEGMNTIAGSLIFSVFDRRALWDLSKKKDSNQRVSIAGNLPGFDIILYFTNEYGQESTLVIYNVRIVDEGQPHSVEDMYIENTMSYIAQDIDLLEPKSENMPSTADFISKKRDELSWMNQQRPTGPLGIPYSYTYK